MRMPTSKAQRRGRFAFASHVRWTLAAMMLVACTTNVQSQVPDPPTGAEIPRLPEGEPLEPGTYALILAQFRITLTVPAGWEGWTYGVTPTREGPEPPTGRGIGFWIVDNIYADPRRWDRGLLDPPPEPSADALAAALKAQWGRYATLPATGELNGSTAIEMDLTVPPDVRFSDCAQDRGKGRGYYLYWPQRGGGGRYAQGPGQREHLWILEAGGARLVVGVSYFPATSPADRDELWDIAQSVQVS
jgi:hypothetical protein